jgi:hypothetical protein
MGYKEEIFERAESQFSDVNKQIAWLSSFERPDRGATKYTRDALEVRDELNTSLSFKNRLDTDSPDELRKVYSEFKSLKFRDNKTESLIQETLNKVEAEEAEQIEQEEEYINKIESLKFTIKESRDLSEIEDAESRLKQINSRVLGGIKSGQVRNKGKTAERLIRLLD